MTHINAFAEEPVWAFYKLFLLEFTVAASGALIGALLRLCSLAPPVQLWRSLRH
jgi:hypothetical protein